LSICSLADRVVQDAKPAVDGWPNYHPDGVREGVAMSNKSPQKGNVKKQGKTLKEKRAAKKLKHADKPSLIPPTGH
jgi:hypothetical protein